MDKNQIINHAMTFGYGGQSYDELATLYDICIDKTVLELGSMVGMSSYVIASVAKYLACIDVWKDTQEHLAHDPQQAGVYASYTDKLPNMLKSFKNNCKEFIKSGKIKMYRGNTIKLVNKFKDKSFDIVFIDADHSYEGVSKDFKLYHSKAKDGGYIVFHDYGDPMWTGIQVFCVEMIMSGKIKLIKVTERIAIFELC